jgi:hypothetical protein
MLALLLVHPLRNRPGHRWIQLYSRSFYAGLFPLIVLLLMAIWRRLSEYGLTEDRYFLLVLTLWMTGIASYFSFGRHPIIKAIPLSLALLAVLHAGWPLGPLSFVPAEPTEAPAESFGTAEHSQEQPCRENLCFASLE